MHSIIDATGHERFLGNIVPAAAPGDGWQVFGDTPTCPLVRREEWPALILKFNHTDPTHPNLPYVHDQDGVGQCNADATAAAAEYTRSVMGLDFVQLSAADLYDRINGGRDRGSLLEDALRE
jgi:hypothetical protein